MIVFDSVKWVAVAILVTSSLTVRLHRGTRSLDGMVVDVGVPGVTPVLSDSQNIVDKNIPVFYNLYLRPDADQHEINRVEALVEDQLSYLIPEIHFPVYVHTIGRELHVPNTTHLAHHNEASEEITLHSLWEYCTRHTDKAVIYLHSKGSFHPFPENDRLRTFLTLGALSRDCAEELTTTGDNDTKCNHCSARFSPLPHPHVPGNMWMAHCSYVSKLINPFDFQEQMNTIYVNRKRMYDSVVGKGRYSAEHWIASRGAILKPCDLYESPKFFWGYSGIPDLTPFRDSKASLPSSLFSLQPAPRFQLEAYSGPIRLRKDQTGLDHRWQEYEALYNETPPLPIPGMTQGSLGDIWWGWRMDEWFTRSLDWSDSALTPPLEW